MHGVAKYGASAPEENVGEILQNVLTLFIQSLFATMRQDIATAEGTAAQATALCNKIKEGHFYLKSRTEVA